MRLTVRGWVVLAAVPILFLGGEALGYALLRVLAGCCAGAVVAAFLIAIRRPQVEVSRELYPNRVEVGKPALAHLRVHNPGTTRQPSCTARDVLGDVHHDVTVRDLAAGASATYRYQLPTRQRGRLPVGPFTLERRDPLGLVRSWVVTGDVATLWVHPRRHPVHTVQLPWPRHHHEGPSPDPLAGATDLRQIREYVLGDELRHVHWKAMARTGTLMVREYADPEQPRFTVVLDNRQGVLAAAALEEAIEVAASLGFAATISGHRTRVVAAAGDLDLRAGSGLVGGRELLDRLTELTAGAGTGVLPRVVDGAVVVISGGSAGGALVRLMGAEHASVVIVDLGPRSRGVDASLAGLRVIQAGDADAAIRAWNGTVA